MALSLRVDRGGNVIFEQMFDTDSSTYTYLLADEATREAVLIDPVLERVEEYAARIAALGLTLRYTMETHVHADHVTAADALRKRFGSKSIVHKDGGAMCANRHIDHGDVIECGSMRFRVLSTPGHTDGCVSYSMSDRVFTGDALLIDGCGRTDFQQGDAGRLWDNIHAHLFTLPDDTLVYPAHDYKGRTHTTIGHEKAHNARLGGGRSREDFIEIMHNLKLAPPKHIARAVPANLACGEEEKPQVH